jgi:hypothetical protein
MLTCGRHCRDGLRKGMLLWGDIAPKPDALADHFGLTPQQAAGLRAYVRYALIRPRVGLWPATVDRNVARAVSLVASVRTSYAAWVCSAAA